MLQALGWAFSQAPEGLWSHRAACLIIAALLCPTRLLAHGTTKLCWVSNVALSCRCAENHSPSVYIHLKACLPCLFPSHCTWPPGAQNVSLCLGSLHFPSYLVYACNSVLASTCIHNHIWTLVLPYQPESTELIQIQALPWPPPWDPPQVA